MELTLREATADDAEILFAWRTDPAARAASFTQASIDRAAHQRWFEAKLAARSSTRIWILLVDGAAAGQIRYDVRENGVAEISLSIDSAQRGRRLGSELLRLSSPRACAELGATSLRGLVKTSNAASIAAFQRAGFTKQGEIAIDDDRAIVFVRSCG